MDPAGYVLLVNAIALGIVSIIVALRRIPDPPKTEGELRGNRHAIKRRSLTVPLVQSDLCIEDALVGLLSEIGSTSVLCLYQADITPAKSDDASTYTGDEADFGGYTRITLNAWGSVTVAAHVAKALETIRVFTYSGSPNNDVYGYFVLDGGGDLLWAEKFPGGLVHMATPGQTLAVQPAWTHESKYP